MANQRVYRCLEMLPGFFIWATLGAVAALTVVRPVLGLTVVVAFDLYWLLKVYYLLVNILVAWRRYRRALHVDWLAEVSASFPAVWRDYWHVVILPTFREPYAVIERTLRSLAASRYPSDRLLVVLAGEERDAPHFATVAAKAKREFATAFAGLLTTVHPMNQPGEIPGKGSNLRHAGRVVQRLLDQLGLPYDHVIVSTFDVDTCPHLQYFALLTATYLRQPHPTRASYQPIAVYTNNVWESNPLVRLVAGTTTFWLLTDLARAQRCFTFSSHSMSFQTLAAVGYWDPAIVTEDSRMFLQCLLHYRGDYQVVPVYLPVAMNTVDVGRFWRSLSNQYRQVRRWAWCVEHFPWMLTHFWGRQQRGYLPPRCKLRYFWNLAEGIYSWATAPLLIFLGSHLALAAARWRGYDVAAEAAARQLSVMAAFGLVGLVVFAALYLTMLPSPPRRLLMYPGLALQWLLMPLTLVVLGALPAIESQTRMMLGGSFRLGFDVTEKT